MAQLAEQRVRFSSLYESPLVRVRDYCCQACRGGPTPEESSDVNNIVLLRHGAFARHFGRRSFTADVNEVAFFSKGSTYRVSHPAEGGDRGTVFSLAPCVLSEIVRELDPDRADPNERPFPFVSGPCEKSQFWRHRKFVLRLEAHDSQPVDPLWADVAALELAADVLAAAFRRHEGGGRRRRPATQVDHAERIEVARAFLAEKLSEPVTLDAVARASHMSPFHFARVFAEQTGLPVHKYLTRLRLRAALERVADGPGDLTAIALALGFSSHSHFADSFKREFGETPSEFRKSARRKRLREMSKNLKV